MTGSASTISPTERIAHQAARIVAACDEPDSTKADLTEALDVVARVESWLSARRGELIRRLDELPGSFPEADIAASTGCTLSAATKETDRSRTLDAAGSFADALDEGDIRPGHVDALTRATKGLNEHDAATLLDGEAELAEVAARTTIREFEQHVGRRVRALQPDTDTEAKLTRQRRDTRLRSWTDQTTGMWNLSGRFDPETGRDLHRVLESAKASLFSDSTPDTAPSDPIERDHHLRALALTRLLTGDESPAAARPGNPIVVVDATTALVSNTNDRAGPCVDWGIPIELPRRVLLDVFGAADPDVVIVANGVVLHAPGRLDLGRSSRIANRDQRRALRGLYATCAVPGCAVHYDRCRLHHVIWWHHGGRTDLDNLLPICQHHHSKLHEELWAVTLGPNRELTITLPDGTVLSTGPPRRSAA